MLSTTGNVIHGAALSVNLMDDVQSLAEFILNRLLAFQETNPIALIDGVTSDELTHKPLLTAAIRVAESLRSLGVTHADKVAICSENRLEVAATMFGTLLVGATLVMVNPTYTVREMQHAVQLAKPSTVLVSATSLDSANKVVEQCAYIRNVISFDGVPNLQNGARKVLDYEKFIGKSAIAATLPFHCMKQDMQTKVAFILYSSGTTGLPKGVKITEMNMLTSIAQSASSVDEEASKLISEPIILTVNPWSHAYGCIGIIKLIARGSRVVYLPQFDAKMYLASIQKYKVNTIHVVPPLMVFLAKHPIIDEYDLSSLKMIGCGAAPLSKELEEAVCARLGVSIVRQGYGMTETTLAITFQTPRHKKIGSVGVLVAGTSGRVVDVETGRSLPANQRGELQFAGPTIMKGYTGDAEATRATIDPDGWLHTGDIGYYDEDGEWFIVDRLKELIKYNGFQVPPAEIEGILLQHPLISDAGVVGVPDERTGELPMAFVVRQANGGSLTEREVMEFVAERASKATWLHGGVRFIAAIPKNPSGKILRRELRSLLGALPSKL